MKALLYTEPYRLEYKDLPKPQVGDDDILVRVRACGICGSDVQGYTGKTGRRIPPLIMGHEAAGIVDAFGKNVTGFAKGDRVCFDSTVYCNQCPACKQRLFNRCAQRQVLGVSTPEFKRHGAFAEYVAVPHWITFKMPDSLSFVEAALLEPVSVAVHAVNRSCVSSCDTVAVVGAGTIGLFVLQASALKGASTRIAVDINDYRLGVARQIGVGHIINSSHSDPREMIAGLPGGRGADVTFEAVGLGHTFRTATDITRQGGQIVAIGNVTKMVEFDLQQLVSRELAVAGSYASAGEFQQCIDLVASCTINVRPLVSEVLPLEQGPAAFERLLKAEENLIKIVLEP